MAKNKSNYGVGPWEMTKDAVKNSFVAVTSLNRKNAIELGRILYHIESIGSKHIFHGTTLVQSRLSKGKWLWPHMPWAIVPKDIQNRTHFETYFDKEEDYNEWKEFYDKIISKGIEEKTLYINPKDPILTFFKK